METCLVEILVCNNPTASMFSFKISVLGQNLFSKYQGVQIQNKLANKHSVL